MELRHIRYFVAVAEGGSFVNAAARLRVAQPAISKQIRDLESEVGVPLFERLPRGVRLTRAGEVFLSEAKSTLENAVRAVAIARRAEETGESNLRFAHGDLIVYASLVAELLAEFRQANPGTLIEIHTLTEQEQYAALREQRVDVVATFVGTWPVRRVAAYRLVDCSFTGVLLPASHVLAQQPRVHLRDLVDLTWLHVSNESWPEAYSVIERALRSRGLVPPRRRSRSPGGPSANVQIAIGDAWALANEATAAPYSAATASIVFRTFLEPPIPLWLTLIWRSDSPSPLVEKFVASTRRLLQRGVGAHPGAVARQRAGFE